MLTQSRIIELFEYRDGALFRKVNVGSTKIGERAGSINKTDGYRYVKIDGTCYPEHRIIYLFHFGIATLLDHINGVRDDNRIENLRPCTVQQNRYNAGLNKNNKSGVKGVFWFKRTKKWSARLGINGKQIHLGYFVNLDEARLIVETERKRLHGEFARDF